MLYFFVELIGDAKGEGASVEVAIVLQVVIADMMADKVVVQECIEVERKTRGKAIAEFHATSQTCIEAAIFAGEGTWFVEIVEIDIVVSHAVGCAFDTLTQPISAEATEQEVTAQTLTAEGEVGHDRQGKVSVAVVGIDRRDVVEVALQAMVALYKAKVGTYAKPRVDRIAAIKPEIKTAKRAIGFIDTVGMGTGDARAAHSATDTNRPLGKSETLQGT